MEGVTDSSRQHQERIQQAQDILKLAAVSPLEVTSEQVTAARNFLIGAGFEVQPAAEQ